MTLPDRSRIVDGINPPPPMSTPREAPWKEIEAIIDGLANLSGQLTTLIGLLSGGVPGGGAITVIIPHKRTVTSGSLAIATITPQTPAETIPSHRY